LATQRGGVEGRGDGLVAEGGEFPQHGKPLVISHTGSAHHAKERIWNCRLLCLFRATMTLYHSHLCTTGMHCLKRHFPCYAYVCNLRLRCDVTTKAPRTPLQSYTHYTARPRLNKHPTVQTQSPIIASFIQSLIHTFTGSANMPAQDAVKTKVQNIIDENPVGMDIFLSTKTTRMYS